MVATERQQGFTLIELVVVVMIVATISGMAVLSINQAFNRRYSSEAEKLHIWMQQLAENSALQGAAYGGVTEADEVSKLSKLRAVIYYRNRWVAVTAPAPFELSDEAELDWLVQTPPEDEALLPQQQEDSDLVGLGSGNSSADELLLPEIAFLPDGYIEPQGEMRLSFKSTDMQFSYHWGEAGSTVLMERLQP